MRCCLITLVAVSVCPTLAPPAGAQGAAGKLNLVVVEGEGAINNIRQRTARAPIVQVEDENHKPIAGATVVFTLPSEGAGGTFAGGVRTLSVVTDSQGRATPRGLRANSTTGNYQIRVRAAYQGRTATAVIGQTNAAAGAAAGAATGISGKLIAIVAVGAAAVTGGIVAATRGGSNGTAAVPAAPSAITVSLGAGTVGAPPR